MNLSRDHAIKRSREFEGRVPPLQVTILPSLKAIGIVEEQICFLSLLRDHVIKRSHDFESGVPPHQVVILPILVAIGIAEEQI